MDMGSNSEASAPRGHQNFVRRCNSFRAVGVIPDALFGSRDFFLAVKYCDTKPSRWINDKNS